MEDKIIKEIRHWRDIYHSYATKGVYWLAYYNALERVIALIDDRKPEYVLAKQYFESRDRNEDNGATVLSEPTNRDNRQSYGDTDID